MSSYSNGNSIKKEKARNQLLDLVKPTISEAVKKWGKRTVKCLSLPADNFSFEEKLRKQSSMYQIYTVENDSEVYKAGLKKAKELQIKHNHDDIFDFMAKSHLKYDVIWLDLCGYLNPKLLNQLIPVVQGKYTPRKALLGLTTMQARENLLIKQKKHYGFNQVSSFRIGFPKYLDYFAEQAGCKLTHYKRFKYISDNGVPMQLQKIIIEKQ